MILKFIILSFVICLFTVRAAAVEILRFNMEFSLKSGRKAREMLRTSVLLDSFEFSRVLVCFFLLFHFPSVGSIEIGFIGADEVKLVSERT